MICSGPWIEARSVFCFARPISGLQQHWPEMPFALWCLSERLQTVSQLCGRGRGSFFPLTWGVLQESNMSPFLIKVYVKTLGEIVRIYGLLLIMSSIHWWHFALHLLFSQPWQNCFPVLSVPGRYRDLDESQLAGGQSRYKGSGVWTEWRKLFQELTDKKNFSLFRVSVFLLPKWFKILGT